MISRILLYTSAILAAIDFVAYLLYLHAHDVPDSANRNSILFLLLVFAASAACLLFGLVLRQ